MKRELKPSANCLLFFVDETGHEEFSDPIYPVFGMGGCAQVAGLCHTFIDEPWSSLYEKHFSSVCRPLHASALRKVTQDQAAALGDFFRFGHFARFAVMTKATTDKPYDLSMMRLVAAALLNQATKIASRFKFDSIAFIFEHSQRTNSCVAQAFSGYKLHDQFGRDVPVTWNFLPKSAKEPGLEVADFVLHAAGGQVRHRHQGKSGFRKDFETVFRGFPKGMVQYIEVTAAEYETSAPKPSDTNSRSE